MLRPRNILKFMTLFIEILFLSWSRSTEFNSSLIWLLIIICHFTRLTLKISFFMVSLKKNFIWNNLLDLLLKGVWSSSKIMLVSPWTKAITQSWFGRFSFTMWCFGFKQDETNHSVFYPHTLPSFRLSVISCSLLSLYIYTCTPLHMIYRTHHLRSITHWFFMSSSKFKCTGGISILAYR